MRTSGRASHFSCTHCRWWRVKSRTTRLKTIAWSQLSNFPQPRMWDSTHPFESSTLVEVLKLSLESKVWIGDLTSRSNRQKRLAPTQRRHRHQIRHHHSHATRRASQTENEWENEWLNEWMNDWINSRVNDCMIESTAGWWSRYSGGRKYQWHCITALLPITMYTRVT